MITYVYIYLSGNPVPAGRLEMIGEGRNAFAHFDYGRRYLERPDRVPLDPIMLPLPNPNDDHRFTTPEGFALFNGIRDAAPDSWGRHVMDKIAGSSLLSEFDYLVATGDDRIGALAFGSNLSGPKPIFSWSDQHLEDNTARLDLSTLLKIIEKIDSIDDLPSQYHHFMLPGSSIGGARPKATTHFEDRLWIAKFGRAEDRYPICRAEYATMVLASKVGLTVPRVALKTILKRNIYLIERFDRIEKEGTIHRIPFISGLTFLGVHESESSQQSYRRLAEHLRLYGSFPQKDMRELWQRMVFNILCSNTDDHLRNHAFLWDGKGWRLSPGYDIVPFPQVASEKFLAIGVGKFGRQATLTNALSSCSAFGLSQSEAFLLVQQMQSIVHHQWEKTFQTAGFSQLEIERLRNCFSACEEVINLPSP